MCGHDYVTDKTGATERFVEFLNTEPTGPILTELDIWRLEQQRAEAYLAGNAEEEAWLDLELRNANAPVSIRG